MDGVEQNRSVIHPYQDDTFVSQKSSDLQPIELK